MFQFDQQPHQKSPHFTAKKISSASSSNILHRSLMIAIART
jgi:hypothetical protein